jgi:hypothetical protein
MTSAVVRTNPFIPDFSLFLPLRPTEAINPVAGFDRSVVALAPVRDLLLCAKDLFVAASRAARPKNDGGVLRLWSW